MCGFLGIVSQTEVNRKTFEASLNLLEHRGPDSTNTRFFPSVTLGFKRLAIQDPSEAGNQPMSLPSSSLHVVFNGEIYNYKTLRHELIQEGATFFSKSDTEVLLHAYQRWGLHKMLDRAEGMFGFALFDEVQRTLILARDRFGMKPLFYKEGHDELLFGSEIKAIIKYTGTCNLDFVNCLNPLLMTGLAPPGQTLFEGIRELEPGHYLECSTETFRVTTSRYFHFSQWISPDYHQELGQYSDDKIIDLYHRTLFDSVAKHTISDVPLASLFSAGLDSSLVSAIANRQLSQKLNLFHFVSELDDDLPQAREFVQKNGGELSIWKGDERRFTLELPRMMYHYETVNKQEGPVLAKLCNQAKNRGYKVLLTGDASDELFGGYATHQSFFLRSRIRHSFLYRWLKKFSYVFGDVVGLGMDPVATDYCLSPAGIHFLEVPMNCLFHGGKRLGAWRQCLDTYSFMRSKVDQETSAFLLDDLSYRLQRFMVRADRLGMMESMELRLPFLDPGVVKLALNSPLRWRMRSPLYRLGRDNRNLCEGKVALRMLAKKVGVPASIIERRKNGTAFKSQQDIARIVRRWSLRHLADFLRIPERSVKEMALHSFTPGLERIQFSFVAMELLIRQSVNQESYEDLTEEFKAILYG